jgi:hypothetical protein
MILMDSQNMVDGTAQGTMNSIIDLYEFCRSNQCSEAQIARVLPALFIHLHTEKLPRILEPNDLQLVPLFSISSLGRLAEMNPLSRTIMDGVQNFWAHLWIWLKSFCTRIKNPGDLPSTIRIMARKSVVRLLAALVTEQDLVFCLCSTTGFISTLYKLWVLEITDISFAHEVTGKPIIFPTVTVLQPCMSFWSLQPCINWMDEVIIPMGGTADIVASVALTHVRRSVSQMSSEDYCSHRAVHDIELLHILARYPPLQSAMLSQHSIQLVTKTLVTFTSQPFPTSHSSLGLCINACLWYLRGELKVSTGLRWIIDALQSQLIIGMLRCGPWNSKLDHQCRSFFLDVLSTHLLYRSVLPVVSRAMEEVADVLLEVQVSELGQIWDQWLGFKKIAGERIALLAGDHTYNVQFECENSKVGHFSLTA